MKLNYYSVFDKVSKTYSQPFLTADSPDHALAIRVFNNMVVDGSMLFANPNDYVFMLIGTFDDNTGKFDNGTQIALCDPDDIITARENAIPGNTDDLIKQIKFNKE